jgi:membrane protein DedA with SNARE-associated domain
MINLAFIADFGALSYLLLFVLLAISGLGISFGDEVLLLFIGYLTYKGVLLLPIAIVVAFLGIVAADNLGFHLGSRIFKWFPKLVRWFPGVLKKSCGIRRRLRDIRYVFVSRFIPNVRMVVPIAAGFYGVSWRRFFRCNVFAAAVFVPVVIALGSYAGPQINQVISFFATFAEIFFVVLAAAALYLVIRRIRSRCANAQ